MDDYFIQDGYEFEGYIAEQPGLHGPLTFWYRGMSASDQDAFNAGLTKAGNPEARSQYVFKWLASRVTRWQEPTVPPSEKALASMRRLLFERVLDIVLGNSPSDAKPDGTTPERFNEVAMEGN